MFDHMPVKCKFDCLWLFTDHSQQFSDFLFLTLTKPRRNWKIRASSITVLIILPAIFWYDFENLATSTIYLKNDKFSLP